MRVLIEMEKLANLYSGLGQFCLHLGKEITLLQPDASFLLPVGSVGVFGDSPSYYEVKKYHRFFPLRQKFDVWHCSHQDSAYLPPSAATKMILTVHDLNFLEKYPKGWKRSYKLYQLQQKINRAAAICTISQFTKNVLAEHIRLPDVPIEVIYNGSALAQNIVPKQPSFDLQNKKFLFSIGIISEKKNFHVLLPLLKANKDLYLVITGNCQTDYAQYILQTAQNLSVADRLVLTGTIDENEKLWLYQNCLAFVFPSLAEGFGIPVVEAMSEGKPVFLSDKTSLPEVGGEYAFYWKDFMPENMQKTLTEGINTYQNTPNYADLLRKQAANFSWQNAAKQYVTLYKSIAE
jgi:glycosyltransferase involved in cell wall biosynthesis